MGQSGEHAQIITVLKSSLQVLATERHWSSVLVESDNFFAWVDGEPFVQVSPDVFLLDNPPPSEEPLPTRWEVWRPGHSPPRLAVEIVSTEWKKDYAINPARYDHLGVSELVLADREACMRDLRATGRAPLLVYRRSADNRLELVYRGKGPAFCAEINAYLCFQWSSPGRPRVRISRDSGGEDIVPTFAEKAAAAEEKAAAAEEKAVAAEEKAVAAEEKAAAAEEKAVAAEEKAVAAEEEAVAVAEKAVAAEEKAAAAEAKMAEQAAELASLRARLRALNGS